MVHFSIQYPSTKSRRAAPTRRRIKHPLRETNPPGVTKRPVWTARCWWPPSVHGFRWNSSSKSDSKKACFLEFDGKSAKIFKARKANSLIYLQIYFTSVEVYKYKSKKLDLANLRHTLQAIFMKKVCCQSLCLTVLMQQSPHIPAHHQDVFSSISAKQCGDYEITLLLYILGWEWLKQSYTCFPKLSSKYWKSLISETSMSRSKQFFARVVTPSSFHRII